MKRIDTQEATTSTLGKGTKKAKYSRINVSEDEFTAIQSSGDLSTVIVTIENGTGNHPVNIRVVGMVTVLEHQEDTLDVFK